MRLTIVFTFLTLLIHSTATFVQGDGPKTDTSKLESMPEKRTPATQIDFNSELQVPLQALSHLGQTIEDAREEADPVCIASAANVLAAAESLAGGKKATITSAQLWDEAIKLAQLRNASAELSVLANLASGEVAADLKERSEAAKASEEAAAAAAAAGETQRDVTGDLHVINQSHEYINLRVDGRCVGWIAPHGHRNLHVHGAFHLTGHSRYHHWHEDVHGHHHHYDWVLHDPHH